MTVIDVTGLTKCYGQKTVVDDVALRIEPGEIMGFLGPNGSGKTTTIRMICGLLTPDAGRGTVLGRDLTREARAIRRDVGYMTQRFSFYEDLSIQENLEFVARLYGLRPVRDHVFKTLTDLNLYHRRRDLAGTLSGGWKQRLALAACVMHEPKLLLLDEPTAGVDPEARREFWDHIHALSASGITVLVSTHYMDEAERCNRISYILRGRLLVTGTATALIEECGLHAFKLLGDGIDVAFGELEGQGSVEQVTVLGNTLHIVGSDLPSLRTAVMPVADRHGLRVESADPSLEDVFVHLVQSTART
ncbi:MAG: ABC transporter ATP-binding protein [Pseudomonadota bacterium]